METWIQNGLAISVPVLLVAGAEIFGSRAQWLSWLAAAVAAGGLLFLLGHVVAVGTALHMRQLLMMPMYMVLFFAFLRTGNDAGLVASIVSAAKETLWCGTEWLPIVAGVLVLLAIMVGIIRLS